MPEILCEPDPTLMESMRSVGYDLNTAVADVIDNSIAADARNIDIYYHDYGEEPFIAIVDDGRGMDRGTAIRAMQLAGNNTSTDRSAQDLGRFGLGLKTASLSQGRSLTLVSRQEGSYAAFRWDLDRLAQSKSWSLEELSEPEIIRSLPNKVRDALPTRHGTCVLWRNLDRLNSILGKTVADLDKAMSDLADYLALVFHRYLYPYHDDPVNQIHIRINNDDVPRRDPFLVNNPAVQKAPPQLIEGTDAVLYGYTLPYQNRLTDEDRSLLGLSEERGKTLFDTQGFYIYRAYRLITWGSWYRMMARSDINKLCRVRIDIPNTLDSQWALDIKKSTATPPKIVRDAMRRFAKSLAKPSRKVQQFRGRKINKDPRAQMWSLIQERNHEFRYEVNQANPYIESFVRTLTPEQRRNFETMMASLASTLPYEDMQTRFAMDERVGVTDALDDQLRTSAQEFWMLNMMVTHLTPEEFVQRYKDSEPFSLSKNAERILEEVCHG
ncbi:ATP-binding protein [Bifidobacterium criceti]|uniref:ATP-binding region ATPase domain-containing protein n=1 Tax=Bifidobacterium criceti TaxID=1960969 RepID=A0A2A2EH98_9BIFI|nr:ATP-binding protein [Bifidobacterium criceti]PAU68278.1 ATP-binding region ATPase domain-containing protein [Bifidobacterium criceti]